MMKINLKRLSVVFSPLFFILLSCSSPNPRFERLLGTICIVNLYEKGTEERYDEIFARFSQIHDEFSLGKKGSDLYNINTRAFKEDVVVSDDVFKVLLASQKISSLTDGNFDISVEPLVSLWHINTSSPHVATQSEIEALLPLVDYKNIVLNTEKKSVRFLKEGMEIDFGGIAKGFAADEVVKICKKHKIKKAVIDLGGNIYVYGKKAGKELWNVGVKNPEFPDEAPLLKLSLPQTSIVTSGVYERFFEEGEKRYHHILSPKNGFPAENNLYSVTVICENSMIADALSTAFFVLGKEKALKLLPAIKDELKASYSELSEISVIFIENDHKIYLSDNFQYNYSVLSQDWSVGNQELFQKKQ